MWNARHVVYVYKLIKLYIRLYTTYTHYIMNDTKLIEKEFNSDLIPGIHIIVEDGTVKLHTPNMALEETNYTQKQICELISLLVEVHDYIDNTKENNTMDLFDEKEDNNIEDIRYKLENRRQTIDDMRMGDEEI